MASTTTPLTTLPTPPHMALGTARRVQGQRLRRFVFTLNNYTAEELSWLTNSFPDGPEKPQWMIFGKETGENGTQHLQGAVCLGRQVSFSTVKTWYGFRRAHLEAMRGSVEDSVRYCSKEDLNPFEIGTRPSPGKRSDLEAVVESIKGGSNMRSIALDHPTAFIKFTRGLTALRNTIVPPRDPSTPPTVYWLFGSTGVGKTKCAWEFGVAHGGPEAIWLSNGGTRWFDGYDSQEVVIFDDLRSKDTSFSSLLRLLDRYPYRVEYKGGFIEWNPRIIIITCPYQPRDCFSKRAEHRPEDIRQIERRLTQMFDFDFEENRDAFISMYGGGPQLARSTDELAGGGLLQ